ncbi:MAG: hypothetical protein JNM98_20575 [Rhodocyclaceae bacterium]|nr:hypothetical protein [Rhodocyclaceae bacterium]
MSALAVAEFLLRQPTGPRFALAQVGVASVRAVNFVDAVNKFGWLFYLAGSVWELFQALLLSVTPRLPSDTI